VAPRRHRIAARVLGLAQLAHAHWFFGNLYEAVVKIPDLLASQARSSEQAMSPSGPGSPVRYYAAAAPATLPALVVAAVVGWSDRSRRPWLVAAAACSISGIASTAYLVRTVNVRLFFTNQTLTADEQETLLRTWYRINAVRLATTAGAWLTIQMAKSRGSRPRESTPLFQ
jgi:hypothetical protein